MIKTVLVLMGATGVGKSDLALGVAKRLGAEVVSADSRQVYRGLSVGTAKPVGEWACGRYVVDGVVHRLLDHVDPREIYTAGRFLREADEALVSLSSRNVPGIVVGGTGLYLRALTRGLAPLPERDLEVRAQWQEKAEKHGRGYLHEQLTKVDPDAARSIPPNNIQRVIRALEVFQLTGRPLSVLQKETTSPTHHRFFFVGLSPDPLWHREHLIARCRGMADGIVCETEKLLGEGVPADAPAFQSLGYREALQHLCGSLTRDQFIEEFTHQTFRYVKRQKTWFRSEPGVVWVSVRGEEALGVVMGLMGRLGLRGYVC